MLTNQNIKAALNAAIVWWICVLLLALALICVDRTDLISNIESRFSGSSHGPKVTFSGKPSIHPTWVKKKHAKWLIAKGRPDSAKFTKKTKM